MKKTIGGFALISMMQLLVQLPCLADIIPSPQPGGPDPDGSPSYFLIIAGTAISVGIASLGLWLRKRKTSARINANF